MMSDLNCLECGACCYLGKRFANKTRNGITLDNEGWCIHHDKDNGCRIYEDRPEICRRFKKGGVTCHRMRKYVRENKIFHEK